MQVLKEIQSLIVPLSRIPNKNGELELVRIVDGRALYKYRVSPGNLDKIERILARPICSDWERIYILAPLAAGRFASRYDGGVKSWDDCGETVSNLYRGNGHRFRDLMADSLKYYKIPILSRNGNELLFETIVGQAGLPSKMLEQGNALRKLLDELIELAVKGEDIDQSAIRIVNENDGIAKAYKEANHLPQLCADLVRAIDKLKNDAGWSGGSLDSIWAVEKWERRLPFLVEENSAREIVGHLLNVAEVAEKASGSDALSIDRILCRFGGLWRLQASMSIPDDGVQLSQPDLPDVVALRYAIDNVPVDEACRLRRQTAVGGTRYKLARVSQDLSEVLASPYRLISLCLPGEAAESLDCRGGEPLDAELPWVFEVGRDGRFTYRDSAPQRLRCSELLVAAPLDAIVSGDAELEPGQLAVPARSMEGKQTRLIWRVRGRAEFAVGNDAPLVVEANYKGPQVHLGFSGKVADVAVPGCSAVFVGDPKPRRIGGLSGLIQWRMSGMAEWRSGTIPAVGKVNCRLTDLEGNALAERRIFVFPETFKQKITGKGVELELGHGFSVPGQHARDGVRWTVDFSANLEITIPIEAPSGQIGLVFLKPSRTAFRNIVTGEQYDHGDHILSARVVGALVARSHVHDRILVQRKGGSHSDVREFLLRGGELRLSSIKAFLAALAFSFRGRTSTVTVEYPNEVKLQIEAVRIKRDGNSVSIGGAGPEVTIELHELVPYAGRPAKCIQLERVDQSKWMIPPLPEGSQYLAIDSSYQAAPCLVAGPSSALQAESRTFAGCVALPDAEERVGRLMDLYESIAANPGEAFKSAQFHICLDWFARFKFVLPWVDPFLVLAQKPELALKVLVVARVRNNVEAQRGLIWALDEVPLFWHMLTPVIEANVTEWAISHFGTQSFEDINAFFRELGMSEKLHSIWGRPRPFFEMTHGAWHAGWQIQALAWTDASAMHFGTRSQAMGALASTLWEKLANNEQLRSLLLCRCNRVPHGVEDLHRTYLLAPFDLALAVAFGIELEPSLRDDLIYARYAINPEQFDESFCFAISLIELLK